MANTTSAFVSDHVDSLTNCLPVAQAEFGRVQVEQPCLPLLRSRAAL